MDALYCVFVHLCRHFRVNAMLTRDSVKKRLDSDQGISFLEFSYQLFQVRSSL